MKINMNGRSITTSTADDVLLAEKIDSDLQKNDLEKIVDIICTNIDLSINYIMDLMFIAGYENVGSSDVAIVVDWLDQKRKS